MRYSAAAFDLDGTLYPSTALYRRAWPLALANARRLAAFAAVRRELRFRSRGEEYGRCLREFGPGAEALAFRRFQAALTARRLGEDASLLEGLIDRVFYRGMGELFAGVRPFRGLTAALDALRDAGLRLALLSDFPPARKLELMGLSGRFEAALCSEDTGFLKPAPEPFAALASALGLPAAEILYVGNSFAYDLAGAKGAGMGAAMITRRKAKGADLGFRDWKDLVRFATA